MSKRSKSFDKELFFRALADQTRLRILNLLGDDEVCVCFLVEILKTNQPKVSRHLAYLKKAGIVTSRRQGTWMHYRIVAPPNMDAARVLEDVRGWLGRDSDMQSDRQKLIKVCCAPELPSSLIGAPRPTSIAVCR